MENHYGIAVKNKYDLFLDDDCDPYEILKTQEEAKQKAKTDKTKKDAKNEKAKSGKTKVPKKPPTPAMDQPKGVDVNANKKDDQKPRGRGKSTDGGERTGSARPFRESGNREIDRPPRRERQDKERTLGNAPAEFRDRTDRPESGRGRGRGERGGGRGRGGARGGGGGGRGGFDRFGKREFERHSGSDKTGVKAVEKREGGGAHNWGTIKDDMEKEKASETLNDSVNDETTESPDTENQNPNAEPEEEVPAEEEGPKEMTLDEWRAQQSQEKKAAQSFNIRKAGEGVDGGQWKKTFVLQKKQPEVESEEEESEDEEEEDPRQKKSLLNIEITFNDQPLRGRGGRRGRGGGERGRGGGGRGRGDGGDRGGERRERSERGGGRGGTFGPRGGNRGDRGSKEVAPHLEDENDFPSLGAK